VSEWLDPVTCGWVTNNLLLPVQSPSVRQLLHPRRLRGIGGTKPSRVVIASHALFATMILITVTLSAAVQSESRRALKAPL
jgi:hypothetical protein